MKTGQPLKSLWPLYDGIRDSIREALHVKHSEEQTAEIINRVRIFANTNEIKDERSLERWVSAASSLIAGIDNNLPSLLEHVSYRPAMDLIIDTMVKETLRINGSGEKKQYGDPVIKPITAYNMASLKGKEILPETFAYKIDSLNDPDFAAPFKGIMQYYKIQLAFLEASSPQHFVERIIENDVPIGRFDNLENLHILLPHMISSHGKEEVARYLEASGTLGKLIDKVGSVYLIIENLEQAQAAAQAPVTKGIFVDVDEALIKEDGKSMRGWQDHSLREERFHEALAEKLKEAQKLGIPVTFFSDGNLETQTIKLQDYGMDIEEGKTFPPLALKADYKGANLEILIGDTLPEPQGFSAKHRVQYASEVQKIVHPLRGTHRPMPEPQGDSVEQGMPMPDPR